MSHRPQRVGRPHHPIEPLERRRLMAWGASAQLMDQDDAVAQFPTITGQGVTVAVLDTGIDYNHPALGGGFGPGKKVKAGFDFANNDADPMDDFGHGTNTAGIIAAGEFTVNGDTYRGVAPNAELVALKIANGGEAVGNATIEKALQWVEANRLTYNISVVNFSFGQGRFNAPETVAQISDEFKRLSDAGVIFFSPSGNDAGTGINWPAADPSVVSVGSVGLSDQTSTFTQRGALLDLLAPGENVGTTNRGGTNGLITLTSFSAPVAAGAAALVKQVDPKFSGKDILSVLRASGQRRDDAGNFYSRVDLDNALTVAFRRANNPATDVGSNATANDLAYDKQGVLHFVYYDQAARTIKYATRATSGLWSATSTLDTSGHDVGATLSLALDPTGKPGVAYYDATEGDLEYARFDGISWRRSTLDSKNIAGQFPSLAFDNAGNPMIAYYRKTSGDARFLRSDGSAWTRTDIDTGGNVGTFMCLAVAKNGAVGVSYADATNANIKYAQLSGSTWTPATVEDLLGGTAFISLAFDNANQPAISYYDAWNANLQYATRPGGTWSPSVVTSRGAVGLFTNLWFDGANNANIVYFNRRSNGVFRVKGTTNNWTAETLKIGGGQNAVAAPSVDASAASYSWFNQAKGKQFVNDLV